MRQPPETDVTVGDACETGPRRREVFADQASIVLPFRPIRNPLHEVSDRNDASTLRRRADELRRFASHVRSSPALLLDRCADIGTWRGPRAFDCVVEFAAARRHVLHGADDLDHRAHRLDRMADELDASGGSAGSPAAPGGHSVVASWAAW